MESTLARNKIHISQTSLNPSNLPCHIAIIMDGNGRWARAHDKRRRDGHFEGYLALKRTVYAADDLDIPYLTVYGFSSENWRRPQEEVFGLMELMATAMTDELDELMENDIRVRVSGRLNEVPDHTRIAFEQASARTANNTRLTFNLAINYGGRAEIVDSVRTLIADAAARGIRPEEISEESISSHLYWPDQPDPDLLIRTAGERRLSNFLLWETAYSEIHVTDDYWPDFGSDQLIAAIADFQTRIRKFGAVVE
ncbi:MAG: polyprenyl diphosphate synthase [Chthonomonadales bacterium]